MCSCRGCVLGVALGRVVAGRFWCSYAWVSLTQVRACAPVGACGRVRALNARAGVRLCARGVERVRACALLLRARVRFLSAPVRVRASSSARACVLGRGCAGVRSCRRSCRRGVAVVWRAVRCGLCRIPLFAGCAVCGGGCLPLLSTVALASFRSLYRYVLAFLSLIASHASLIY